MSVPKWVGLSVAEFPARPKALVWPSGIVMDAEHPVRWGNWTCRFGPQTAAHKARTVGDPPVTPWASITIMGLLAENPVEGQMLASIAMDWDPRYKVSKASVWNDSGTLALFIDLPIDLVLEGH